MKPPFSLLHAGIATLCAASALAQNPAAPTPAVQLEQVVVTASPLGLSAFDLAQPVSTLSGKQLQLKMAPTLGETLNGEPGIVGSYFAPGASRPIIRGLADNRVLVLNNGTDIFDVSNLSPDHTPSVQPLLAQRIEVVRGAATILYGSSAIGGVVNVLDNRIPTEVPGQPIKGEIVSRFESADLERSGAASFDIRATDHIVLHIDGAIRRTEDLRVPDFALDDRIRGELTPAQIDRGNSFGGDPRHVVPNTSVFSRDLGVGASYVWDKGFVGASFSQFLSVYGTPDDPEVDDPVAFPDRVRIDMTKRQYSLRSSVADPLPFFVNGNFKFSYTEYRHLEIDRSQEGVDAIGSTFKTRGFDTRLELQHQAIGKMEGSIGVQALYKDLSVLGDSSFLQPTHTLQLAGFVFEEIKLAPVSLQFGGRVEYNRVQIASDDPTLTSLTPGSDKKREFIPVSVAAGAVYDFAKDTNIALTARYSERAPTAEELFARGSHDATFQFLVGDPDLGKERVLGVDLTLRKRAGVITGSIGGFYNHFFEFIEFNNTGAEEDGLPVFDYTAKRADFIGGEAQVAWHFLPQTVTVPGAHHDGKSVKEIVTGQDETSAPNPHDLYFEVKADYVHAQDLTEGRPLPRIPPLRYGAALVYEGPKFGGRIELQRVNEQDRVSEFETTTPGYTFLNASVNYTFNLGPTACDLYVRGTNLTDAVARDHTSFLKDVLPMPGRSVSVGMRVTF
jgi:iron complex outermembrane receptor protein